MKENHMKIDLIKPISLCFGVESSINKIKQCAAENKDASIFCLGLPVHNEIIAKELENLGINIIDAKPNEFESLLLTFPKNSIIIFSAHGHDRKLDEICKERSLKYIDTICPIVASIQRKIEEYIENGKEVLYIGKENHPESYSVLKNAPLVKFWDISSSFLVDFSTNYPIVFNQTTILKNKLEPFYRKILEKASGGIVKNTSCKFVNDRYEALIKLYHSDYDLVIVAGSKNSSNTNELYEKTIEIFGKEKALLISKADELKSYKFNDVNNVLILSGTSAPQILIDEIKEILTQS